MFFHALCLSTPRLCSCIKMSEVVFLYKDVDDTSSAFPYAQFSRVRIFCPSFPFNPFTLYVHILSFSAGPSPGYPRVLSNSFRDSGVFLCFLSFSLLTGIAFFLASPFYFPEVPVVGIVLLCRCRCVCWCRLCWCRGKCIVVGRIYTEFYYKLSYCFAVILIVLSVGRAPLLFREPAELGFFPQTPMEKLCCPRRR